MQLLEQRLTSPDCQALGWLLDGFPHTKAQAARLAAAGVVPDKAVFLDGTHAVLMERVRWGWTGLLGVVAAVEHAGVRVARAL